MKSIDSRAHARDTTGGGTKTTLLDRLLASLDFDASVIDGIIGDLTEEHGRRRSADGVLRANAWYAREVARSLPHWVVAGFRRGDAHTRVHIVGTVALLLLFATSGVTAYFSRDGAAASIVFRGGDPVDGVVINHTEPTVLQTNVLDDRGHRLFNEHVEFYRVSGASMAVSPAGVVHCTENADATVRATVRGVDTKLAIHCRPVHELRVSDFVDYVVGDAPRALPFVAIGVDGQPVTQLRGITTIVDTSVAAVEGARLEPRAPGQTDLTVSVGDRSKKMRVVVHSLVSSFSTLRADETHVAIPVRLAQGDTSTFALPRGVFWLKYLPRVPGEAPPTITLAGGANCGASDGLRSYRIESDVVMTYCVVERGGASVTVAHGTHGLPMVRGSLALDRVEQAVTP